MSQLALCFDPPKPAPVGVWVDRWPDHPGCPGARIFIRPQVLMDEQGRMGVQRWPGLVGARLYLLRQVENYRQPLDSLDGPQARSNQAGWLQWQLFQMGGIAAAW